MSSISNQYALFSPISKSKFYNSIEKDLMKIVKKKLNPIDVMAKLDYFEQISSGRKIQQKKQNYEKFALYTQYCEQIPDLFSKIGGLILEIQKQNINIPILFAGKEKQANMSRRNVVYLMSLMAMNLVPKQSYSKRTFNKDNNFSFIFEKSVYKTKCIVEYFLSYFAQKQGFSPTENLVIRRQVEYRRSSDILKLTQSQELIPYQLCQDNVSIESQKGSIKIDFSNKYIGGGALRNGCVQEEIMFSNHPEMYVSMLICEAMGQNQAIVFQNFKKFFKNSGYSYSTMFAGAEKCTNDKEKEIIIAIDAVNYQNNPYFQKQRKLIDRQILKAYTGFKIKSNRAIATGKWGCGAFKGDTTVKFLIQWIACSMANKKMIYCPFGEKKNLEKELSSLTKRQKLKTIRQAYETLTKVTLQKKLKFPKSGDHQTYSSLQIIGFVLLCILFVAFLYLVNKQLNFKLFQRSR